MREEFNKQDDIILKSAIFVYLNRHGFNGLCRYNYKGEFNVPFGRYKKPYFPEKELNHFYKHFREAALFTNLDFEEVMEQAVIGDVVYCDPPYVPLSPTSSFTSYSAGGFTEKDQIRLAECAKRLSKKGINVIISNHYNEFTASIYSDAVIDVFPVQRFISCDGSNRNAVKEILAVF